MKLLLSTASVFMFLALPQFAFAFGATGANPNTRWQSYRAPKVGKPAKRQVSNSGTSYQSREALKRENESLKRRLINMQKVHIQTLSKLNLNFTKSMFKERQIRKSLHNKAPYLNAKLNQLKTLEIKTGCKTNGKGIYECPKPYCGIGKGGKALMTFSLSVSEAEENLYKSGVIPGSIVSDEYDNRRGFNNVSYSSNSVVGGSDGVFRASGATK